MEPVNQKTVLEIYFSGISIKNEKTNILFISLFESFESLSIEYKSKVANNALNNFMINIF